MDLGYDTRKRKSRKLRVGSTNDRREQEADRVAAAVVRRRQPAADDNAPPIVADAPGLLPDGGPGATRIRRSAQGAGASAAPTAAPKIRAMSGGTVIRRLLDPSAEDDVFDIAQGKRDAELANMRLGSKGIGASDPRRQKLESFFSDPSKQKGSRSRPAKLTGGGGGSPDAAGRGNSPSAPLPAVMVVGADATTAPRSKEQADAEHKIRDIAQAAKAKTPARTGEIGALETRALTEVAALGKNKLAKKNRSIGQADDMAELAAQAQAIVERFEADIARAAEAAEWEATVEERRVFVAGKADAAMATKALDRAKQAIPLAGQIYDLIYAPLGFDDGRIARVTALGAEQRLIGLHATFPAAAWAAFVTAATTGPAGRLDFAINNAATLAAVAAPGPALRVWFANEAKVGSAANAQAILGLSLVANDPVVGAAAAKLIGLSMIPDLATLTQINNSGSFTSIDEIKQLSALGGDLVTTREIRALAAPPHDKHITAFNERAGANATEVAASWTNVKSKTTDATVRAQMVRALALAPDAGKTDLKRMADNWSAMSERTTVEGDVVAQLVSKGMLVARGKTYNSGTWGHGAVYVFEVPGGGRIEAEWHIHFKSGGGNREATVAGAGWKNAAQKYGVGAKSFDGNETKLVQAMRATGKWLIKIF